MNPEVRELAERSAAECRNGTGEWKRGICLACIVRTGKADRRGSFSFNTSNGFFVCHKCSLRGRIDGDWEEMPAPQASPLIEWKPPQGFYEVGRGDGAAAEVTRAVREYIEGRGLTDKQVWREARLGTCLEGFYADRVVVPVLTPDDEWNGFVTRTYLPGDTRPKYLYPKGFNRHQLYNAAALNVQTEEPVLVVEGVLDVLALWPNAVAVFGGWTEPQVWALCDCPRPVVAVMDGDAWEDSRELAMRLQLEGQRAGYVRLPPKVDPDEAGREWLTAAARRSI